MRKLGDILRIRKFLVFTLNFARSLWNELGKVVFHDTNADSIELLESATSAMRAALEKLAEARVDMFQQLKIDDVQPILNGERQCPNANVRANLIRIVGSLAMILVRKETIENVDLVKVMILIY